MINETQTTKGASRKQYTEGFKRKILAKLDGGATIAELSKKYSVGAQNIQNWKRSLSSVASVGARAFNSDKSVSQNTLMFVFERGRSATVSYSPGLSAEQAQIVCDSLLHGIV